MVAAFDYDGIGGHGAKMSAPACFSSRIASGSWTRAWRRFNRFSGMARLARSSSADTHPVVGDHVFASIQSLNSQGRIDALDPEHYDVVIVDEFHHAEAPDLRASAGAGPSPDPPGSHRNPGTPRRQRCPPVVRRAHGLRDASLARVGPGTARAVPLLRRPRQRGSQPCPIHARTLRRRRARWPLHREPRAGRRSS